MCLIHTHHVDTKLSDAWIKNFYDHNSDGIGVMYSEPDERGVNQLVVKKYLPKDEADAVTFYHDTIKGRECVVHWRMATHGDIDLHNCHPYEVTPLGSPKPLWMMHNGVLSYGNFADKSKSDTWHYINDILKPFLDPEQGGNPDLAFSYAFRELVGEAIGNNNRFVFMDADGKVSIVNKWTGVEWNHMWMSNTYAWDAPNSVHRKGKAGEVRDMTHDHMDEPDDWANAYRAQRSYFGQSSFNEGFGTALYPTKAGTYTGAGSVSTGVTKGNGTVVTGKVFGGGKKNKKRKSKGALVPAGVTPAVPVGSRTKTEREQQQYWLDQQDEIFALLDDEGKRAAYSKLTYQNFTAFMNKYDLDTLWDAVYMCVDNVLSEESFIDYMHNPEKWSSSGAQPKIDVGSGESYPLSNAYVPSIEEQDELQAELDYENESVIASTLPRQMVSESTSRFAEAAARELDQVRAAG
jgi:hypothetical protein